LLQSILPVAREQGGRDRHGQVFLVVTPWERGDLRFALGALAAYEVSMRPRQHGGYCADED